MTHTDVYDAHGQLILSTIGIDIASWDALNPMWAIALVFERKVRTNTTGRLEWNDLKAIVRRGHAIERFN